MKEGWKYVKFEDCLVKVPKQKQVKSKDYLASGLYPIVSQEFDLISGYCNDESFLFHHDSPIVIFGDHTKNIKYIDFDFVVGADGTHILSTKEDINIKYFFYALKSLKLRDLGYARHYKLLKEKYIPVPPLSEQQRIVSRLDASFAKIDALSKQAEEALEQGKALFQATIEDLISEDKIGNIKSLEEISSDMFRGSGIKRDQVTENGISCVRYGEIYTTYNYHFDTCKSHTNEDEISPKKYFEKGDILFAITGESVEEIGKSIAYTGDEKCLAGGDIVVMKHNQNPRYISYALSTKSAVRQKGFGKTKLKVVHTNVPSLKSIKIPIPSLDEQDRIANTLDSLSQKIQQLQQNYNQTLANCQALKQALLKETFE